MKRCRKNRKVCLRKWAAFISLLCIVSLMASGCGQGGKGEGSGQADQTEDVGKPGGTESGDTGQPGENTEPKDSGQSGDGAGTDEGNPAGESKDKEAVPEGEPDLTGEIKELDGQGFTAIENKIEKSQNGGDVMVAPGQGADDSDYNKIFVTYGENTTFSIRTIYDGGARFEDEEASAKDLAEGISVNVWGEKSGDTLNAKIVRIIKVVF